MSILEILDRVNWGYRKAGKSIVCRCPFCKNNDLKKDNHDAQVNEDNLYCFSSGKTYGEKDLLELFNLSSVETVEPFKRLSKTCYAPAKETGEPTVVKHNQLNLNDVYKKDVENRNKDEDTFISKLSKIIPDKLQISNDLYFRLGLWGEGGDTDLTVPVFEDGKLSKNQYRKYKLETPGPDDYGMMREVLTRRYEKLKSKGETPPDLIVVDGGRGQLNVATEVLDSLDLKTGVIGLAKEFEQVFIPEVSIPLILPPNSPALHILQYVRDEAHRFAVKYHKNLRDKMLKSSPLDEIPGVGPKRKMNLLRHFGDLKSIQNASVDEIADVKSIDTNLARKIYYHLHQGKD